MKKYVNRLTLLISAICLSPLMAFDRQCAMEKEAAYELDKDPDDFHIRINDDEE